MRTPTARPFFALSDVELSGLRERVRTELRPLAGLRVESRVEGRSGRLEGNVRSVVRTFTQIASVV
jgi:hypothetical protein